MKGLINTLRNAAQKHAAYRRIVNEISTMSAREADDLGIARTDAHRIAHQAIYGY